MRMPQVHVEFDEAVTVIRGLAERASGVAGRLRVVGITGPVGAGKSTLAARLADGTDSCVISTDHYLPDYERVEESRRDLPEESDLVRLLSDLRGLRERSMAEIPMWSFQSHSRVGYQHVRASGLVVVEGLHALHETHAEQVDVRVYVDAPRGVRWKRWEKLEESGERGWGVEVARAFFENVAEPTFHARAAAYRAGADVVVSNG